MESVTKNYNPIEVEEDGPFSAHEVEITGEDLMTGEIQEENQKEIKRLEKLNQDKKDFIEKIRNNEIDSGQNVTKRYKIKIILARKILEQD